MDKFVIEGPVRLSGEVAIAGAKNAALPCMTTPGSVAVGTFVAFAIPSACVSLARPKSRILTRPSFVTKTFSGFRSRWTMPFSCAAASPWAIWIAYSIALRGENRPLASSERSVSPSSSSWTTYGAPSCVPRSRTAVMLG